MTTHRKRGVAGDLNWVLIATDETLTNFLRKVRSIKNTALGRNTNPQPTPLELQPQPLVRSLRTDNVLSPQTAVKSLN